MRHVIALVAAAAFAQAPGEKTSRMPVVPPGTDGTVEIPVTFIRGVRPGPTVALIAGNHGYEYPPILGAIPLRAGQVVEFAIVLAKRGPRAADVPLTPAES